MWQYRDYLTISEDFIPVFSEHQDTKDNWKFFIPHEQMRVLLDKLIKALGRAHSEDKLSLWLTGAYGTGKTFACFVVKHLLEDDTADIEDYFSKHSTISSMWPRFKALREGGPYLVVYKSASGHITSNRRLMIEVQQAISERLRAKGYKRIFGVSVMDQILAKLEDANGVFNWEAALLKHQDRFLAVSSRDKLIEKLRAGDTELGEKVADVLEEEGIALLDSPDSVKAWIKEVIAANELRGIVFVWDEFTEFFTNNVPVTPLQELAQVTGDTPFYLVLVTHRALSQFSRIDDETRRKLENRFHNCQLEMSPVTAYKLIGNAIEAYPSNLSEWEAKRDSLWGPVDKAALHINVLGERVNKSDLKQMVPIHPYTAYLLSTISSLFSSSQRTLFQFLKTDEPGSFQWFVESYPKDEWYWLTPDYLWQYFFENARLENVDIISDVISYCRAVRPSLGTDEEQRVFCLALLLVALGRQTQGAHELLRPRLSNIRSMFIGSSLSGRVDAVLDSLCASGTLLAVPSGEDAEYLIPTATIDQTKLLDYKKRAEAGLALERMVDVGRTDAEFAKGLIELVGVHGAVQVRFPIHIVSAKDLRLKRDRVLQGVENPFEVGLVFVVAQEDEHLVGTDELATELSRDNPGYCILISQAPFGVKRWGEWIDSRARSWYHQEIRDGNMERYYAGRASGIMHEWLGGVRAGKVRSHFRGRSQELVGCAAIESFLKGISRAVYPDGPETIAETSTLYTSTWGKSGAEIGLRVAENINQPYKEVVDRLSRQGLWEDGALRGHSGHPLGKMQEVVDRAFAAKDHVTLKELWQALEFPPYGLMPSAMGILLFGVLLRPYAQGYYYSDGVNSLPLNPNKLADLILQVLKKPDQAGNYSIRKMSSQGEEFCRIARKVFHLTSEQAAYPEEARKNMRKVVVEIGYPLWTLVFYSNNHFSSAAILDGIKLATSSLSSILNYDNGDLTDPLMADMVARVRPVADELAKVLSRDKMQEGMKTFLVSGEPRLSGVMDSLHLEVTGMMSQLRSLVAEDPYLWQEKRIAEKLPEIGRDLALTVALNGLSGTVKQSLAEATAYFRSQWFKGKLPLLCFKEGQPAEISALIGNLHGIVYGSGPRSMDYRGEDIGLLKERLVLVLNSGPSVVLAMVRNLTGHEIDQREATAVYEALPNLSQSSTEEVKSALLSVLSSQSRQQMIARLRSRWREITNSESPGAWSEQARTPIQWVLQGAAHREFLASWTNLPQLQESEIQGLLAYLDGHGSYLATLQDESFVLSQFMLVAAGDYSDLVGHDGNPRVLRDFVYQSMAGKVYTWPARLNEVQSFVRKWVNENYRVTAYPRVLKAIQAIPASSLKGFIERLAAEDARVGARLLAMVQKTTNA